MVRHAREEAHHDGRPKKWLETPEGWAKANLLYEFSKAAGRLPSEGSVREAIFLGVWLRHQEIEANKVSVMANGLVSPITGSAKSTSEAFRAVIEGMFPFLEKTRGVEDKKLVEKMQEEVKKGPLFFSPVVMKPLRSAMKKFEVSDKFKEKLQKRVRRRE